MEIQGQSVQYQLGSEDSNYYNLTTANNLCSQSDCSADIPIYITLRNLKNPS
jgi:hypothetical protein